MPGACLAPLAAGNSEQKAERDYYRDLVLKGRFETALHQLNLWINEKADGSTFGVKGGVKSDAEIARAQLNAAHFVVWVISAESGVMSEQDLCFLQSLRLGIPLLVVISRADKRPASDIAAIADRVR